MKNDYSKEISADKPLVIFGGLGGWALRWTFNPFRIASG